MSTAAPLISMVKTPATTAPIRTMRSPSLVESLRSSEKVQRPTSRGGGSNLHVSAPIAASQLKKTLGCDGSYRNSPRRWSSAPPGCSACLFPKLGRGNRKDGEWSVDEQRRGMTRAELEKRILKLHKGGTGKRFRMLPISDMPDCPLLRLFRPKTDIRRLPFHHPRRCSHSASLALPLQASARVQDRSGCQLDKRIREIIASGEAKPTDGFVRRLMVSP
jgi:hypothetical protein